MSLSTRAIGVADFDGIAGIPVAIEAQVPKRTTTNWQESLSGSLRQQGQSSRATTASAFCKSGSVSETRVSRMLTLSRAGSSWLPVLCDLFGGA